MGLGAFQSSALGAWLPNIGEKCKTLRPLSQKVGNRFRAVTGPKADSNATQIWRAPLRFAEEQN